MGHGLCDPGQAAPPQQAGSSPGPRDIQHGTRVDHADPQHPLRRLVTPLSQTLGFAGLVFSGGRACDSDGISALSGHAISSMSSRILLLTPYILSHTLDWR